MRYDCPQCGQDMRLPPDAYERRYYAALDEITALGPLDGLGVDVLKKRIEKAWDLLSQASCYKASQGLTIKLLAQKARKALEGE